MTSAPTGRYPTSLFTRQHLEPIETHRDQVLSRDEHTCSAHDVALTGRYWHGVLPCSTDLVVVPAVEGADAPATSPIFLRTLCSSHAALAGAATPAIRLLFTLNGWRIPAHVPDPLAYAAVVPVRWGDGWWLLDNWGERRPVAEEWAAELRAALHARWPA